MYLSRAINILAVLIGIIFLSAVCTADEPAEKEGITWVNYDEGIKLAEKLDKIIFIDFYTNWCKWCHKMDQDTFSDKKVIDYFNEHFIAIKVNAESKTKMKLPDGEFNGRELARMYGVRGYPTYWFVKSDGAKIDQLSSYLPPDRFLPIIRYIGDGHYQNMTFKDYMDQNSKNE